MLLSGSTAGALEQAFIDVRAAPEWQSFVRLLQLRAYDLVQLICVPRAGARCKREVRWQACKLETFRSRNKGSRSAGSAALEPRAPDKFVKMVAKLQNSF